LPLSGPLLVAGVAVRSKPDGDALGDADVGEALGDDDDGDGLVGDAAAEVGCADVAAGSAWVEACGQRDGDDGRRRREQRAPVSRHCC